MRPLQAFLCVLFCTGVFIVFGLGMHRLGAEGHIRTDFARSDAPQHPPAPPPVIVLGSQADPRDIEMTALARRLADADTALRVPGGTRQQVLDAQAEYYNDLCMLHLLATRSPRTAIPQAALIRMRDTPMEQACGEP
jgi:hypothetical protein